MTETDDNKLKMTIYVPTALVHALDALKVEDQQRPRETEVTLNTSRPEYVVWALAQYVRHRRADPPLQTKKRR